MAVERITIVTELIDKISGRLRKVQEVTKDFNRTQGQVVETTRKLNEKTNQMNVAVRKTTKGIRAFNFAWLSVMFAGMALYRVFGGIIRKQMELWGLMEGFSAMMTVVMLPVMEMLSDILWPIIDFFMNLPEPIQKAIGLFILLAAVFGAILMIVGQVALAFGGFVLLWPTLGAVVGPILAAIFGSLGLILIVIAAIIAIGIGMYLAWKSNFLGMKTVIKIFVDSIKQMFGGLIGIIKGILNIIKGIFKGDFDLVKKGIIQVFKGLWNFLIGGWKVMMAVTVAIVIGALKIVYGFIKVIIDGIGWIIGKAGKLFGKSGKPAWKLPSFQKGGIMPHTGLAYLHKGETIVPAGATTTISPNITINATISSDYDVKRLAEELKRYWVTDFERVSKGRGI